MVAASVPIRVLVIDDHPLFRRGVGQLFALDATFDLVGEAASGEDGVRLAAELEPDLVLLDLHMKGEDGIATLARLRDAGSEAKVLMLTVSDEPQDLVAAIRAGADGYLLKDMEPEDLLAALRRGVEGETVLAPRLAGALAKALRQEGESSERARAALTDRESEIVRCLAGGMSNKLIARELGIAEGTVKVHVKALLKKLRFRSRVEVAVWAVETGLR